MLGTLIFNEIAIGGNHDFQAGAELGTCGPDVVQRHGGPLQLTGVDVWVGGVAGPPLNDTPDAIVEGVQVWAVGWPGGPGPEILKIDR